MNIQNISLFILLFAFSACKKNSKQHPVPSYPFDMTINFDLPSYSQLVGVGGYTYVSGGSRGIIVYRRATDDFVAFDRHSPKDPDLTCPNPLLPDADNFLQLNDSCSGAIFSLYDGSAISGSEFGLRQYQTIWNGSNMLRIYN
jgi:hypothetical protein